MKTKFLFRTVLFLLLGGILLSCEGPEGPEGPPGPPGNANVIASDWIVPQWSSAYFYSHPIQKYDWTASELTEELTNTAVVLVYWKNWQSEIKLLPAILADGNTEFDYYYKPGVITLYVIHLDGSTPNAPPESNVFRYVLVPQASVAARTGDALSALEKTMSEQGIDIHDYYQVCDYLGIQP